MTIMLCGSSLRQILGPICVFFLWISSGQAQRNESLTPTSVTDAHLLTATLKGTVVDERDAVVPDAIVLVRESDGALKQEVKTNREGRFLFELLAPRSYTVWVRHQGFLPIEIKDLILKVDEQIALKIQLRVGNIGETVTIASVGPSLRNTSTVETEIDGNLIENLPASGRTLQPFMAIIPGTVVTRSVFTEQGQFSVNGQRANANYFLVDGVSANIGVAAGAGLGQSGAGSLPALSVLGTTNSLFSLDALREFKVQTSTYAPEFGRAPGAQVSISTRPGTNQVRGSVFEYFRHDALEANDWFANSGRLKSSRLRHHDFGGVIGGPVIKDRAFFFLSYEGVRISSPQVTTKEVPSLSARQAAPVQLRPYLNAFPIPNGEKTTEGLAIFTATYSEPSASNATALRVDYKLRKSLTLFGRYNYSPSTMTQRGASSSLNTTLFTSAQTQTITAGANLAISPGTFNEFRINYSRVSARKDFVLDDLGGAVIPNHSLLLPSSVSHQDSVYGFSLGNGASFLIGRDIDNLQRQLNLVDNLSMLKGTHQLKLGIDYRRLFPIYGQRKYNQVVTFNGVAGALSGMASSVSVSTQDRVALIFTNFSAYVQDLWRVKPRLTVTYGLRWELNPAPQGRDGQHLFTALGVDNPATLSLAPLGTPHYKSANGNFAPRVGFAYQLFETQGRETLLRAGLGLFYDLGAGTVANAASYFPYLRRKSFANVQYPLEASTAEARPFSLNPPFSTIRVFEPNFGLPLTLQWNMTIEQSLGSGQTLAVSYVGAAGRRLLRSEALINPNADFQQVFIATNKGASDYHALQLQLQRRLSRGLQALVAYTWSHSIDINSNDSLNNAPSSKLDPRADRGPSDFDVRHSFGAAVAYDLPRIKVGNLGERLLRNWSIDTIVIARTATPVDIVSGRDIGFGLFNFRPDRVDGVALYIRDPSAPGGKILNRAAFGLPATARQGTLPRNALRGFPVSQLNLGLRRSLKLTERYDLNFRAEFTNLFNHPNFGDPVGDLSSGLFGHSTSMFGRSLGSGGSNGGLNPLYQVGGPRSIQLAVRLNF